MRRLLAPAVLSAVAVMAAAIPAAAYTVPDSPTTALAWEQATIDGRSELMLAAADGSNPRRVGPHLYVDGVPAVAPDGAGIVVSSPNGNETGYDGLELVRADGTVTTLTKPAHASDTDPAWSPDGTRIAAVRNTGFPGSSVAQLIVFSPGGPVRVLANVKGKLHDPAWSPDGKTLAYTDAQGLQTITVDGTHHPGLQVKGKNLRQPVWRPDSLAWAVIQLQANGKTQLDVAYKQHLHALGRYVGGVESPQWDPDSQGLLVLTYHGVGESGRSAVSLAHVNTAGIVSVIRSLPVLTHGLSRGMNPTGTPVPQG
jgi:Tol biopolymer transport system component